jgi:hypothetical protein
MARPGEDDVDFSFEFPEQDHPGGQQTAASAGGANAFGGVPPRGRDAAAAPPPDMHEEFDALPDSPTSFGQDPTVHRDDDSFDDVGGAEGGGPSAFGDAEHVDGAPRIYADGDHDHQISGDEPIENFGEEGPVDLDGHDAEHIADHGHDEDDENVLRHAGRHDDEEHGLDDAPVAAQRSLLSRMIMPVGAIAVLGAVGYGAWSYVSPMLFGPSAVQTAQGPQRIQMPPTTTMPNGLPAGSPAAQRPPMPQEGQLRPAPQRPAPSTPAPSMLQPQQPPPAAQPVQVASAVPEGMTGMNRPPQPQADDALKGIAAQLDSIGANIGRVNSRLEVLERAAQADRSDFSGRIAALESKGPVPAAKAPTPTSSPIMPSASPIEAKPAPAKETKAPSLVSEPKKAKAAVAKAESVDEEVARKARRGGKASGRSRHVKSDAADAGGDPGDVAMAGDEPPAKPVRIPGLRLKAVSEINGRSMVSVQTSKGRTEEFTVGQSIPGAGEIQSIRQNGGSWVVVTRRGVIVE